MLDAVDIICAIVQWASRIVLEVIVIAGFREFFWRRDIIGHVFTVPGCRIRLWPIRCRPYTSPRKRGIVAIRVQIADLEPGDAFRLSQGVLSAEMLLASPPWMVPCPSQALCARPAHLYAKSTLTC